jgi:hypothetical protein
MLKQLEMIIQVVLENIWKFILKSMSYFFIFLNLSKFIFDYFIFSGVIIGAKISEYLLEKSRIVSQASDERNYHVFYELLTGLTEEQKQKYGLIDANKYFYLNQV